ncbi:MAG: hypothetical protein MJY69_05530 [Bacteroidales bacterium]|nr:hypothetical protein [Bacteroidales bacterium]
MRRFLIIVAKLIAGTVLIVFAVCFISSVSPVYRFGKPHGFEGPDIFNPYAGLDTALGWKRANFHTHTKVTGIFNECDFWPDEVLGRYEDFGYDIVTFSNHNKLTEHPSDASLQVNVYEHGYNLFKFHKLVFGCSDVMRFDHLLPFFAFQRQFQLDLLAKDADFIQLNHPFRTNFTSRRIMERLSGYRIVELDSGITTENEYWDWALSAGHYSFGLANDDLHFPDRSERFAVRCNWLNTNSAGYADIKKTLMSGTYYSMRVPDFGNGDWKVKREKNLCLPAIENIGVASDTVFIVLDRPARQIKAFGQDHAVLDSLSCADRMECILGPDEPYLRFTACFDDGTVIYANPFARYDSSVSDSPYKDTEHLVNVPLTIMFNVLMAGLAAVCIFLLMKLFKKN